MSAWNLTQTFCLRCVHCVKHCVRCVKFFCKHLALRLAVDSSLLEYTQVSLASLWVRWIEIQLWLEEGGNVTSAEWQVTLCDPVWKLSSSSNEASCRLLYSVYYNLLYSQGKVWGNYQTCFIFNSVQRVIQWHSTLCLKKTRHQTLAHKFTKY